MNSIEEQNEIYLQKLKDNLDKYEIAIKEIKNALDDYGIDNGKVEQEITDIIKEMENELWVF